MFKSKVSYESSDHFEALVFSAALQLLEHYKLPADRDDRYMRREHPERWPLTERSLRQPSGKRAKGFDGLTYDMREWLKYGVKFEAPAEIDFGLHVLAWWHRDVWNDSLSRTTHKSYASFMRDFLVTERGIAAHLVPDDLAALRKLYRVEDQKAAA